MDPYADHTLYAFTEHSQTAIPYTDDLSGLFAIPQDLSDGQPVRNTSYTNSPLPFGAWRQSRSQYEDQRGLGVSGQYLNQTTIPTTFNATTRPTPTYNAYGPAPNPNQYTPAHVVEGRGDIPMNTQFALRHERLASAFRWTPAALGEDLTSYGQQGGAGALDSLVPDVPGLHSTGFILPGSSDGDGGSVAVWQASEEQYFPENRPQLEEGPPNAHVQAHYAAATSGTEHLVDSADMGDHDTSIITLFAPAIAPSYAEDLDTPYHTPIDAEHRSSYSELSAHVAFLTSGQPGAGASNYHTRALPSPRPSPPPSPSPPHSIPPVVHDHPPASPQDLADSPLFGQFQVHVHFPGSAQARRRRRSSARPWSISSSVSPMPPLDMLDTLDYPSPSTSTAASLSYHSHHAWTPSPSGYDFNSLALPNMNGNGTASASTSSSSPIPLPPIASEYSFPSSSPSSSAPLSSSRPRPQPRPHSTPPAILVSHLHSQKPPALLPALGPRMGLGNDDDADDVRWKRPQHLACTFCRKRKIACGRPAMGSVDSRCK
ncbi:hypothetical protein H0H81_010973 [Sphagnurus paluster]|uniref:Uncharacterized protein n=1 Tax=Sphagnurus paluster TaxID=117069 RepID=A0A9P7KKP5_9AGAR|nr:hypothetical protein H0H81_010973 [Sphagnurus paluster]